MVLWGLTFMREIKITQGYTAIVDDEDYEKVNSLKWCILKGKQNTYARRTVNGKTLLMHHFLYGKNPKGFEYDHVNGSGLDNRRCNVRLCTQNENHYNERTRKVNKKANYKGVDIFKGKFRARATFNHNTIHLGYYDNEIDAAKAYNKFASEHFGEFARLNVI